MTDYRAQFRAYRAEVDLCECPTCRATGPAALDIRLGMLRTGHHQRMTLADRAADAREVKADRLTHLRTTGVSASYIEAVERGYVKFSGAFMQTGIGAGAGCGRP